MDDLGRGRSQRRREWRSEWHDRRGYRERDRDDQDDRGDRGRSVRLCQLDMRRTITEGHRTLRTYTDGSTWAKTQVMTKSTPERIRPMGIRPGWAQRLLCFALALNPEVSGESSNGPGARQPPACADVASFVDSQGYACSSDGCKPTLKRALQIAIVLDQPNHCRLSAAEHLCLEKSILSVFSEHL